MLRRYLEINEYIKQALQLSNDLHKYTAEYDESLNKLCEMLQPVQDAVLTYIE